MDNPRLEEWAPFYQGGVLVITGKIFGHPSRKDGTEVTTSPLESLIGDKAETANTTYVLGQFLQVAES